MSHRSHSLLSAVTLLCFANLFAIPEVSAAEDVDDASNPETPASTPAAPDPPPAPFRFTRWQEDFSYLADPDRRRGDFWEPYRYVKLPFGDETWYASFGGQLRNNFDSWDHVFLGIWPASDRLDYFTNRIHLLADAHFGSNFRAFVEIGDNRDFRSEFVSPAQNNRWDVRQVFIDAVVPVGPGSLTLRPGRFEMTLGNLGTRPLVGTRDGSNLRFTYDGFQAIYNGKDGAVLQAFHVNPTLTRIGTFDDYPDRSTDFSGVYARLPGNPLPHSKLDLYALRIHRDTTNFLDRSDEETRYTWAARLVGAHAGWDWDVEFDYQNGDYGTESIRAWGAITRGGYRFRDVRTQPRLSFQAEAFSGGSSQGTMKTFNSPFYNTRYINNGTWVGIFNVISARAVLDLSLRPNLIAQLTAGHLWREDEQDAVYGFFGPLTASSGNGRDIGDSYNFDLAWFPARNYSLYFSAGYLDAGRVITAAGGRSATYVGLSSDLKF